MKKRLALLSVLLLLAAGCSTNETKEEKREVTPIKNDEFKNLPDWILQPTYSKGIAAVGEAKIGAAGLAFAKTEALANARNELARQIQVEVDNMFTSYTNVVGTGDSQSVEKVASEVSKQIASVSLKGSKQLNIWISEKNEVYVLVGVDNSVLNEQTKVAISDKALYQEFKAKNAQEELAQEVDKKFKTN